MGSLRWSYFGDSYTFENDEGLVSAEPPHLIRVPLRDFTNSGLMSAFLNFIVRDILLVTSVSRVGRPWACLLCFLLAMRL